MPHPIPRLFVLRRDQDVTGVSGAGDVADGVQWPDGTVVLRWREKPSTAVWDSVDLMLSVHGHDGATRVVWTDEGSRGRTILADAVGRAYGLADRWEGAHGSAMFLVRAAGAELRDVLDEAQADGPAPAAGECSAQYTRFSDDRRQCIRAAQHRGDHIDEHGFHWSDTAAIYPISDGRPRCGRASASSCASPDHACKVCGECMYEHPGEGGCTEAAECTADVELATERAISADLRVENRALRAKAARVPELEAALDRARSYANLGAKCFQENHARQLGEARLLAAGAKQRADRGERQRNDVAQALREALASFREVKAFPSGDVIAHEAPHVVHPSNFKRWQAALTGLPKNCQTCGCKDCPHETEA